VGNASYKICDRTQAKAIAHSRKTNAIAFFRFSRKAIAFSSRSAQVKAIANSSQANMIALTVMGKGDRQPKTNACDRRL
jgi:hypothetical protein